MDESSTNPGGVGLGGFASTASDFRAIADASPALLWVTDPEGRCTYVNHGWYEFTGQREGEGLDLQWLEAVHPEDRAAAHEGFRIAHEARTPTRIQYRLRHRDGAYRWVTDAGRPRFGADGAFVGFVGTVLDVHDRVHAELSVRNRARQQEAVAELGSFALRNLGSDDADLSTFMDRAVRLIAETLEIEYCKVLELLPGGDYVKLIAGVGWQEGLVGHAVVDTGRDSQAGYTLLSDEPVIVDELASDTRFNGPPLLTQHGVVSGMSCVITGPDGEPWGVLGAHTVRRRPFSQDDVHFLQAIANLLGAALQRQRTVQALRESEARLKAVLEQLPAGVVITDAGGAMLYGNPAVEDLFGAPFRGSSNPLEAGEWPLYEPDGDDPLPRERAPIVRALVHGEAVSGQETRILRPDGSWRYASVNSAPVWDDQGRVSMGVAAFMDITDRKLAAEERDRERTVLEAVLDSLPVGVLIADAEGRLVRGNQASRELWGSIPDIDSWKAYGDFEAWWPDTSKRIAADEWAMTRALTRGEVTRDELVMNRPFGGEEVRFYLNNAAPVRDPNGQIIGGVVAMMDVTDRLAAERAIREHKEQLEQRVHERTLQVRQLASSLSRAEQAERSRIAQVLHDDVQQLLYTLKIQVQLLRESGHPETVRSELGEAQRLLQDAIDATRRLTLSTNPPVLREEGLAAALRWLAEDVAESFSIEVELDVDLDERTPVDVDERALLLHTVRELLFNVVKHAGVDRARLLAHQQNGELVVEVADRGAGFDSAEAMAKPSRTFGLGNIRERLQLNGGRLEVDTAPGRGTRAIVRLPVDSALAADGE